MSRKKNIEVYGTNIAFCIEIPVKLANISLSAVLNIRVYGNVPKETCPKGYGYDVEDVDRCNIMYMDFPITGHENYKKFVDFHKSIGIDINEFINKKIQEEIDKINIDKIIVNNGFDKIFA